MSIQEKHLGIIGLSSVLLFILALIGFGTANEDFNFLNDFISKLGAIGEPNALGFNLIGFVGTGLLFSAFGLLYGMLHKDKLLAILLSLFGVGLAFTAIPVDMQANESAISKAHIVAICLGLACWMFGLSRLGYNQSLGKRIRNRANVAAIVLMLAIIGFVIGLYAMPVTHRLVFGVVFTWTIMSSLELIFPPKKQLSPSKNIS